MTNRGQPPLPKPYVFVPITPLERRDRQHPRGHERYHPGTLAGTINGKLLVQTPLHVWSGEITMTGRRDTPLVKSHLRANGRPAVPGSTFKGVVRSIAEAFTHSCVRVTRARPNQLPQGAVACRSREQLCLACRIFGAMDFQGHVRFSDAVLAKGTELVIVGMPSLFAPRNRERVYYKDNDQVVGRKFYQHGKPVQGNTPVEACPVGAALEFGLHFENLSPAELGVLLIALGQGDGVQSPRLWPKLGAGKPVCYGTVAVAIAELRVEEAGAAMYASYDPPAPQPATTWSTYLQAARELVIPERLQSLAQILQWPSNRDCPDRNY